MATISAAAMSTSKVSFTSGGSALFQNMVLSSLDGFRRKHAVKFMTTWMLVGPQLDSFIHVSVNFNALVSQSRMVECTQHIVDNFVNRYIGIIPGKDNATVVIYL